MNTLKVSSILRAGGYRNLSANYEYGFNNARVWTYFHAVDGEDSGAGPSLKRRLASSPGSLLDSLCFIGSPVSSLCWLAAVIGHASLKTQLGVNCKQMAALSSTFVNRVSAKSSDLRSVGRYLICFEAFQGLVSSTGMKFQHRQDKWIGARGR